jgi:hypothetical protein
MDASLTTDRIAKRERCSLRKVNMTISLAFLAPDLVKAASLLPGNGILPPETNVCKRPSKSDLTFAETDRSHTTAPIRGVSTKGRKISVREGLCGGAGRTRTSNQAVRRHQRPATSRTSERGVGSSLAQPRFTPRGDFSSVLFSMDTELIKDLS